MVELRELRRKLINEQLNEEVKALYGDFFIKSNALQKQLDEIKSDYTIRDAARDRLKYKVMCKQIGFSEEHEEYLLRHWATVWIPGMSLSFFVLICYVLL